jgi:hypothetical protein
LKFISYQFQRGNSNLCYQAEQLIKFIYYSDGFAGKSFNIGAEDDGSISDDEGKDEMRVQSLEDELDQNDPVGKESTHPTGDVLLADYTIHIRSKTDEFVKRKLGFNMVVNLYADKKATPTRHINDGCLLRRPMTPRGCPISAVQSTSTLELELEEIEDEVKCKCWDLVISVRFAEQLHLM